MLFDEPKLLKREARRVGVLRCCFSALRRAEIAEMINISGIIDVIRCFSALRRAEIAERSGAANRARGRWVSVLFDEPKLLNPSCESYSQNSIEFQCSSTSRNC